MRCPNERVSFDISALRMKLQWDFHPPMTLTALNGSFSRRMSRMRKFPRSMATRLSDNHFATRPPAAGAIIRQSLIARQMRAPSASALTLAQTMLDGPVAKGAADPIAACNHPLAAD